ncbi:MAG TPA: YncE family protein [Bryobacteraceae bacterium]|nr:YncE family protein [Bryobacteraceae bacterium]
MLDGTTMLLKCCALAGLVCAILAAADEAVVVVHKGADSIGIYKTKDGAAVATIPVGKAPHELVLSAGERLAYVTNYGVGSYTSMEPGGNSISIIDLEKRAPAGEIVLGDYHRPHGIERGASGRLYVTVDFPPAVLVIDPAARKVVKAHKLEDTMPHMIVLTRDESKAYVGCSGSASVAIIDLTNGATNSIEVGGVPMGLTLSPDERRVFATTRTANNVAVIDTATAKLRTAIAIPGQPVRLRISPDKRWLVVTTIGSGEAFAVDLLTLKPTYKVPIGRAAEGIEFDHKGAFFYVTAQGDNKIVKVSTDTWRPVLEIKTGERPDTPAIFGLK